MSQIVINPQPSQPIQINPVGVPQSAEQIKQKLESLTGNDRLDVSAIKGISSQSAYVHTQSVASVEWIVNHNFGYAPRSVEVRSPSGAVMLAESIGVSLNQERVYFSSPQTGSVFIV